MKKDPNAHALRVLEYDRIREVLASYAASPLGKQLARRLQPLTSMDLMAQAHEQAQEMRTLLRRDVRIPLAGSRDVVSELDRVKRHGRPAEAEQLYHVVELLRVGVRLRGLLGENSATPQLAALARTIEDKPELRDEIPQRVDPRDGVRSEASPKLAELRQRIERLREQLREKARRMLSSPELRGAFQGGGVTIKHDRYLVPVKGEYRARVRGPIRDRSHSGSTLFVEPESMTQQGDELVDCVDKERGEVLRILWELTRKVLDARPVLRRVQESIARIDLTFAKAAYAEAFGLESPQIEPQNVLDLRDARHPYLMWLARDTHKDHRSIDLERVHASVRALSVRLGERYRVVVVTGPNTGGKTVALKTIGLNVLLALSGVPIAASAQSRVPCYQGVFADIGDEQSIEQSLSTFSSHLTQIINVLRRAEGRALILFDELGAGTDPLEGAALGQAILDRCLERGWHTVITTHIGSLKSYAFARDGVENAAMEFDEESLQPTYRLLMGVPGRSMALAVAGRMGFDEALLAAAAEQVESDGGPSQQVIRGMEKSRRRIERERKRVESARRKATGEAREYEERKRELDAEKDGLRREMEEAVDETLRHAKAKLQPLMDRLSNLPQSHARTVNELREEVERLLVSAPLGERREAFARSLKKGSSVYVPKFRSTGEVRKIDKGGRRLTLLLNSMSVEISFDDVSWIDAGGTEG